jgi:leukotriene-A4 hydrolase
MSDRHSFARPHEARVTHLSLALSVDFGGRVLRGTATLDLAIEGDAESVVLDTRQLAIAAVTDGAGRALAYELAPEDPVLGSALTVRLPEGTRRVVIDYATSPDAGALQWLDPEQTAGGRHPFLFTQGQAILTRTWIPIQDSPAVRLTYDATIEVPAPLVALMSAERLSSARGGSFAFRMNEPIPAYLIALTVGEIACRELGPRTAVFAEPAVIERAAYEFGEMEQMIDAVEPLVGPYLWGRFDVVVMPPSFPYGGMENPRLIFASPTLLAGDRSLTTVIAHELAHAWAGNLVVNATWNDFWLNEGTTVYLELRMNEVLWGRERAELLKSWGFRELAGAIDGMGEGSPDTRLCYDMTGRDPAEGVTVVPYLKGAAFFWTLEKAVGRDRLDAWLRGWFERHAFRSVTTDIFLRDLREHLNPPGMDLDRWVNDPGLPREAEPPPSALLSRVDAASAAVLAGEPPASVDIQGWTPQAWRHFLGTLLAARPEGALLTALDEAFRLSKSGNAELLLPWLRLEARARRDLAIPRIESFLAEQGRYKFLRPLYADLLSTEWGAPIARRTYEGARRRYHALVRSGLDKLFAASV